MEPNSSQSLLYSMIPSLHFLGETMLNTASTQQPSINPFRLTNAIASLIGVTFVISASISVEARPIVVIGQPLPTTQIIGSPIPSPIPLVPGTTTPYLFSPYNDRDYNTVIMPRRGVSDYRNYNTVITPGRRIIDNSTLINPTIINSRISDSVLVNPTIINSRQYPSSPYDYGYDYGYGGSRFTYTSPGIRIRLGQ